MSEADAVHVELMIGRKVRDAEGRALGRLEEMVVELDNGELVVREYHTGTAGLLEHLTTITFGSSLSAKIGKRGYVIPADQLDWSDPRRLRARCRRSQLEKRA